MRVLSHRLLQDNGRPVRFMETPNKSGVITPKYLVIHYTAGRSLDSTVAWFQNKQAKASAHLVIGRGGEIVQMAAFNRKTWHAGRSSWDGVDGLNAHSIGIELDNRGDGPFAAAMMDALEGLLGGILDRWAIAPDRVIGHACMAPGRKMDPGPRFDWRRLARAGLAVWPTGGTDPAPGRARDPAALLAAFTADALRFGYPSAAPDVLLRVVRDRFRPWVHGAHGALDAQDVAIMADLARRFPVDRPDPTA